MGESSESDDPFVDALQGHPLFRANGGHSTVGVGVDARLNMFVLQGQSDGGGSQLHLVDLKKLFSSSPSSPSSPSSSSPSSSSSSRELKCQPPVPPSLDRVLVNVSGSYLCLFGRGGVHVMRAPRSFVRQDEYPLYEIGEYFHEEGVAEVLQVEWHPLSENHLVILTSDARLRVYNVDRDCKRCEQEFDLSLSEQDYDGRGRGGRNPHFTSFTFGPKRGWEAFTIYLLRDSGAVHCLCPVLPEGCVVPPSLATALKGGTPVRDAWVMELKRGEMAADTGNFYVFTPEMCRAFPPALQGPFACQNEQPQGEALSLSCLKVLDVCPTIIMRGFSCGTVDVLVGIPNIMPHFGPSPERVDEEEDVVEVDDTQLLLFDRVCLRGESQSGTGVKFLIDSYDDTGVFFQSQQVVLLQMGWLDKLRELCDTPERSRDISKLSNLIQSLDTRCRTISNGGVGGEGCRSVVLVSDPMLGRYCCAVLPDGSLEVAAVTKRKVRSLLALEESRQQAALLAEEQKASATSAFPDKFKFFLDTYKGFRMEMAGGKAALAKMRLDSPEAMQKFIDLQKKYNVVFRDVAALQKSMESHMASLGSSETGVSRDEQALERLAHEIANRAENNKRLREQLRLHGELNRNLRDSCRDLLDFRLSTLPIQTHAERAFEERVLARREDTLALRARIQAVEKKVRLVEAHKCRARNPAAEGGELGLVAVRKVKPILEEQVAHQAQCAAEVERLAKDLTRVEKKVASMKSPLLLH